MVQVLLADREHLDGIMAVEEEEFGPVGDGAAAPRAVMERRIAICHERRVRGAPGWFWVAVHDGTVVGYLILQPTALTPEACVSWSAATDDGTIERSFNPDGENVYVVSLAVSGRAPPGATDLILISSLASWAHHGGRYIFCSRMPGFAAEHARSRVRPSDYWQLTRADGSPADWMLHLYWERSGGGKPIRLLENGFPPDVESGGHGVLFALDDPYAAILATASFVYRGGTVAGWRRRHSPENGVDGDPPSDESSGAVAHHTGE